MAIVMNRVSTKSKRALRFDDLNCGDIFNDKIGNWYMKTYYQYDECCELQGNAINLNNGDSSLFDDDYTVIKLKRNLTIDYSDDDTTEWYE